QAADDDLKKEHGTCLVLFLPSRRSRRGAVGRRGEAVDLVRGTLRDEFVGVVARDRLASARSRLADAPPAGSDDRPAAGRAQLLGALAARLAPGFGRDIAGRGVPARAPAACRVSDAVEGSEDLERRADAALDLDGLAGAAAVAAGAAAVGTQFLAPEDQRR